MKIHANICGPMSVKHIGGNSYFLTMKTARERYTRVKILKSESEAMKFIIEYIAWLDRNSKESVKRVHSDSVKDFLVMRTELNKL